MVSRYFNIFNELEGSIFLFGARQTGKSTFLEQQFKGVEYFDLLDSGLRRRLSMKPELLFEILKDKEDGSIVVIDEIPEIPELLNEVHRLIQKKGLKFVLCGSSARKLRRKGYNTLGGRAVPCYFYPFVSAELPDLDLDRALLYGMLPAHYLSNRPELLLSAYIDVYLREEIKEEALVRNIDAFQRFLEVAAMSDTEIVNYTNIASDCGVSAKAVKEYFNILQDTLIGYMIPAYTKSNGRRLTQAPKFYFFDVGIYNHLMHRTSLAPCSNEYGHCFEHFVIQELVAYIGYTHNRHSLSYWHTYNGKEIDAVIGDAEIGIEIKSTEEIKSRHLVNFKDFKDEYPSSRCIAVSKDTFNRIVNGVECIHISDFLRRLWQSELF